MTKFIIKIELYGNPDDENYHLLTDAMEAATFSSKVILSGILYWLPPAVYIWEGTATIQAVEALTVEAVLPIWADYGIMITKTDSFIGYLNLRPV